MGVCMSRCYTEARRLSCWQLKAGVEDRDRLIDFDMFLDEQPNPRPVSMNNTLHESDLSSSDVSLIQASDVESDVSEILFQLGVDNEEVELQDETAVEASKEAMKMKEVAENSTELMNPARLAIENNLLLPIKEKYPGKMHGSRQSGNEKETEIDKESPNCSTPSSPAELEWENEDGLSPVTHMPGNDDISSSSDTASCVSQLSTPVSNGNEELEWDGHFTSTHISQLDMETERLISEIERLTSGVLEDQSSKS